MKICDTRHPIYIVVLHLLNNQKAYFLKFKKEKSLNIELCQKTKILVFYPLLAPLTHNHEMRIN